MEHLVESHLGGYYVSDLEVNEIEEYCEQCGDSDTVILSWEEGMREETLKSYFSRLLIPKRVIIAYYETGMTKEDIIEEIDYEFENDRIMINYLLERKIISKEEEIDLLNIINSFQKKQSDFLEIIFKELEKDSKVKVLKK